MPSRNGLASLPCVWLYETTQQLNLDHVSASTCILLLFYVLWSIWKSKNEAIFIGRCPNPIASLIISKTQCYEIINPTNSPLQKVLKRPSEAIIKRWRPSRAPFVNVNFDASFEQTLGKRFCGCCV